jgi:fucose permease
MEYGLKHIDVVIQAMIGFGLAPLYPMGIVLAETRIPLTEKWTSRFLAAGAVGGMLVPWFVGMLLRASPTALGWAELGFIVVQVASYRLVARMPELNLKGGLDG